MQVGCSLRFTTKPQEGPCEGKAGADERQQHEDGEQRGGKSERGRMRETEMKTEGERNEGDQRHVEFTIALLG